MKDRAGALAFVLLVGGAGAQDAARIEGLVLDPRSRPVANAAVQVEQDGAVIARTQTDAEGLFVVGHLPHRWLVVRATTAAPDVGATTVAFEHGPRVFTHVHTMPARRVSGTVRDDHGQPLAGAWVACTPTGAPELGALGCHTTSDAAGAFELTHVPFGDNVLRIWCQGFAAAAVPLDGADDRRVDERLGHDEDAHYCLEVAHATAAELAQAHVVVAAVQLSTPLPLPPAVRRPVQDADGHWWLRGWSDQDQLRARLVLPGACIDPRELVIEPGSVRRKRTFYLESGDDALLRGSLHSSDGSPVAGVELQVRADAPATGLRTEAPPWMQHDWLPFTTAADGTFAVRSPVPTGDLLQVRCGNTNTTLRIADVDTRATGPGGSLRCSFRRNVPLAFEVRRASTLHASLRTADGLPLRGAEVLVRAAAEQPFTAIDGRGVHFHGAAADVLVTGSTDTEGRVLLARLDLPVGESLMLQVSGPGGLLAHVFVAGDDALVNLGELRTGAPVRLHGSVLGANPAGARFALECHSGARSRRLAVADREGRFLAEGLVPGTCLIAPLTGKGAQVVQLEPGDNEVECAGP